MKRIPKIDNRKSEEIEQQILELAAQYVPEWKPSLGDAGLTLVHIFSNMLEGTLERLNRMPYKNYIYFLNLLGARQESFVPAGGYLKIELATQTEGSIKIPKGTRFYGQKEDGTRVLFESTEECQAVSNEIETIYQVGEDRDIITAVPVKSEGGFLGFSFFEPEGNNLQERRLTFTQPYSLTGTASLTVRLRIIHKNRMKQQYRLTELFSDPLIVCWEQKTSYGWQPVLWKREGENDLILELPECEEETEYNGRIERFLSCRLLAKIEPKEIAFTQIFLGAFKAHVLPDCLYYNDRQLAGEWIEPFGERGSIYDDFLLGCREAFSKGGAKITITFTLSFKITGEKKETADTENFPENGYRFTRRGRKKRKAMFKKEEPEEIPEQFKMPIRISWEYFNGSGWAALIAGNSRAYEDIFAKESGQVQMTFVCPNDIKEWIAGANASLFIRARLLEVSNEQKLEARYCFPSIGNIQVEYTYGQKLPIVSSVLIEKDGMVESVRLDADAEKEIVFYQKKSEKPSIYLKLAAPLKKGVVTLFWRVKEKTDGIGTILVESYSKENEKEGWARLAVVDETEGMKHSGRMTLSCSEASKLLSLFGITGYFLRITSLEAISKTGHPKILGIDWNIVKLIQQESMEPEYFTADAGETYKICSLSGKNILEPEVWVDEWEAYQQEQSMQELEELEQKRQGETAVVLGEDGRINSRFVKWEQRENFLLAKPEDRVYVVNPIEGKILFGDGRHGKLPARYHSCKILVNYRTCLGAKGNLPKGTMFGVADPIPSIRKAIGVEAFFGGCDMETSAKAAESFTETMKYLDRAVCEEDFELLAKRADRTISRVKVISKKDGLTLVILPKQPSGSEGHFEQIRQRVWEVLKQKAPLTLTTGDFLHITEVTYIEFDVHVEGVLADTANYFEVYHRLEEKLTNYFHPVTGDFLGEGFEIGKLPPRMKIFHLIKAVEGVETIKSLTICCFERREGKRKELSFEQAAKVQTAVPTNGTHTIILTAGSEKMGGK